MGFPGSGYSYRIRIGLFIQLRILIRNPWSPYKTASLISKRRLTTNSSIAQFAQFISVLNNLQFVEAKFKIPFPWFTLSMGQLTLIYPLHGTADMWQVDQVWNYTGSRYIEYKVSRFKSFMVQNQADYAQKLLSSCWYSLIFFLWSFVCMKTFLTERSSLISWFQLIILIKI